jgi:DNA-binding MarR family transcriptional regulator
VTRWLDDREQSAWRALLAMNARLLARLNRQLQDTCGLSIADYEILVALTDVGERSLRMGELGQMVEWEKSRLSKQVTRMAARGLVVRRDCDDDRRVAYVDLTDAGRAAIESAAPAHVALVRHLVFDALDDQQVDALADIAATVLGRLDLDQDEEAAAPAGIRPGG